MNAAEFRAGCWVGRRGDSAVLWTPEGFGGCDARVFTDRAIEVPWADLGMIGEGRWRLVKDVVHERFSTGSGRAAHLGVDWVVDTVGSRLPDHAHTQRSSSGSASESCRITVIPAWRGHLLCFSCDGTVCVGCVARRHLATQPALVASTRLRPDATLLDTLDRIEAKDAARFADQVDRVLVTSRIGSAAPGGVWFLGRDGGIRPVTWLRRPECGWACAEAGAERTLEDLVDPDCGIVTRVVSSRVSEHLWQSAAHGSSTLEGLAPGAVAELSRGVDPDPAAARIKALAEAGERYALVASANAFIRAAMDSRRVLARCAGLR